MNASELIERIHIKYGNKGGLVIENVANSTGFSAGTFIDALSVDTWGDYGYRRAFEVKVSRSDLLKELGMPHKNEFFRDHCHEFWYVCAKGIVKDMSEIPDGCGLLVPYGAGLSVKKQAQRKKCESVPSSFLAAIARRALERGVTDIQKVRDECRNKIKNFKTEDEEYIRLKAIRGAVEEGFRKAGSHIDLEYCDAKEVAGRVEKKIKKFREHIERELDDKVKLIGSWLEDIRSNTSETLAMILALNSFSEEQFSVQNKWSKPEFAEALKHYIISDKERANYQILKGFLEKNNGQLF